MARRERILAAGAAFFIAAYFLALTHDAVHAYFALDDSGNLYRSWFYTLAELVKANLLFFLTSVFRRPAGSAWYRSIFYFAGYNPVPFHVVNLAILTANIWLTYAVARRLTYSREVGAFCALLVAYHPRFAYLYFDTAYIYDVLCYFFYFCALLFYLQVRDRQRPLRAWELATCSAIFICALNSKEMAVTLPVVIATYELIYNQARFGSLRDIGRWFIGNGRVVLLTASLTLLFIIGRASGKDSLLENAAYQPVFTADRFMTTSQNFVNELFFGTNLFSSLGVLLLWTGLSLIAWATKSRPLKFAWFFLMLTAVPVAFVNRAAPQYYIPLFGWALYAAVALVAGSKYLLPARFESLRGPVLFVGFGAAMFLSYRGTGWANVPFVSLEGELLRSVADGIRRAHPSVRPGARLLFLDDPLGPNGLDLTFLVQLLYHDPTLVVDRLRTGQPLDTKLIASYEFVFDYRLGRFYTSFEARPLRPQPALAFEWGQLAVFHKDWSHVTQRDPARPGETVIAMATDLGDTRPAVPHGQAFPKDPLLEVASPVQVHVARLPADVSLKIGWPEHVNRFRVDFRIPEDVPLGDADVVISTRDATGPGVSIPVR